jgi:hypothetical protein
MYPSHLTREPTSIAISHLDASVDGGGPICGSCYLKSFFVKVLMFYIGVVKYDFMLMGLKIITYK